MIAVKMDVSQVMGKFSQALRGMEQLTGFDQRAILRAEAGSILKTWAGRTKVATMAQVERRERKRAIRELGYTRAFDKGDVTVNAGWRPAPFGRVWVKVSNGRKFALARGPKFSPGPNRFGKTWEADIRDAEQDVQAALANRLPKARRAAGLARQSVVQIADGLGIDLLKVPGGGVSTAGLTKARAAMASSGRAYRNGSGFSGGDNIRPYIMLLNGLPYGRRMGMDRTLIGIMAGRAKYFQRSYAAGAFRSMERMAKAYPGLFSVTAGPAA